MCERCDAYADQRPTTTTAALDAVLALVRSAEDAGDLEWLDGDERLRRQAPGVGRGTLARRGRWICAGCSRVFLLEVNASHPLGDCWRPLFGN